MSLPPEVPQPVNRPNAQPESADQLQEMEREMTGFERGTLRWAKVAVILSALAALFVCLQWWEMHQGGIDTHALAKAAGDAADAAADQADAAQQFSDTAEDINDRMSDAIDQLKAAADNAKASIAATQKSFRADQRAWVGLGEYQILQFNAKDPFKMSIPMVNSGKSPAVSTDSAVKYLITPTYRKGPPDVVKYLFTPASAVPPQGKYVIGITQTEAPKFYEAITSGTEFLYFYGVFRYHDVYNPAVTHVTTFCLHYDMALKEMGFCESGNDMN